MPETNNSSQSIRMNNEVRLEIKQDWNFQSKIAPQLSQHCVSNVSLMRPQCIPNAFPVPNASYKINLRLGGKIQQKQYPEAPTRSALKNVHSKIAKKYPHLQKCIIFIGAPMGRRRSRCDIGRFLLWICHYPDSRRLFGGKIRWQPAFWPWHPGHGLLHIIDACCRKGRPFLIYCCEAFGRPWRGKKFPSIQAFIYIWPNVFYGFFHAYF